MASFSTSSKTYAKDNLSKCATTILLVCCYLYRKRSNTININAKAKEQGRDMQTPIDDFGIFIEVSRSAQASPSPRWSLSQGIPHKGQAPSRVTSWIASGLPHMQVGLRCAFRQASPGCSSPSSLSSFWPKRRRPCSLRYTVAATPQTRLVWSRKTTSPFDIQQWCAQAPSGKRYANLTKH